MKEILFLIDATTLHNLDNLVKVKNGQTRSDLISQAIREYLERHLPDNSVIELNDKAFDDFLTSLDAAPTPEEIQGLRRLKGIRYPWNEQHQ